MTESVYLDVDGRLLGTYIDHIEDAGSFPVGATGEPGVMPSGEVAAIPGVGLPIPPTCAKAEVLPSSAAAAHRQDLEMVMCRFPFIDVPRRSSWPSRYLTLRNAARNGRQNAPNAASLIQCRLLRL